MASAHDGAQRLCEEAPGWQVFQTITQRWWAIRWDLSLAEIQAGTKATLDADDLDQLTQMITESAART